jgi:hypothetical protein
MSGKIIKIYKYILGLFLKQEKNSEFKYLQSKEELEKHLREQINFLRSSCDAYDRGDKKEAKRIASIIRTLVHDTSRSKSLLNQLGIKDNLRFHDSSYEEKSKEPGAIRIGTYAALVGISSFGYIPYLDDSLGKDMVSFNDYWEKVIFIDQEHNTFTRKDIVLYLANKDGGSHVGPSLDERYAKLSRQNSIGWKVGVDNEPIELSGVELAAMRQIGHEILKTLVPNYSKKMVTGGGGIVAGGGIFFVPTNKKFR